MSCAARHGDVRCVKTQLHATYSVFGLARSVTGDPRAYHHPRIPATLREFTIHCDLLRFFHTVLVNLRRVGGLVLWDRSPMCYQAYARAYAADTTWLEPLLAMPRRRIRSCSSTYPSRPLCDASTTAPTSQSTAIKVGSCSATSARAVPGSAYAWRTSWS